MSDYSPSVRPVTGRHMLLIMLAFFGVIIAVNVTMVRFATSSFGGLVVKNSYIASQQFEANRDLARAQPMASWEITVESVGGEPLRLALSQAGQPVQARTLTAHAERPTHGRSSADLILTPAQGGYVADAPLAAGIWNLALSSPDGQLRTVRILVPEQRK